MDPLEAVREGSPYRLNVLTVYVEHLLEDLK